MNKQYCARLIEFSINDFKKKYSGSIIGVAWAYIQIMVTVLIYWIVFQYGLKASGAEGVPFLAWFIAGYMPWMLFADIISSTIGSLNEYSYIVKKVVFDIEVIPISKILGCLFVHLAFLVVVIGIAITYGIFSGFFLIQVLYYLFAELMLVIPIALCCSTINVFFKDFAQIVTIVLNMMMWATPIVWDFSVVHGWVKYVFMLNPMYYIVQGFRDSILYSKGIWESWQIGVYFWIIVVILWIKGLRIFRDMLPHLADSL